MVRFMSQGDICKHYLPNASAHCRTRMAKVEYADAIKTVSGALTKINKKSEHAADQKMVLATHRTAPTTSKACSRLYLRGLSAVTRTTPVSADEQAIRTRFSKVSKAVQARHKNLSYVASDLAAFKAQKDEPNGKNTLMAYLCMVVGDAYDANPNDAMFQG